MFEAASGILLLARVSNGVLAAAPTLAIAALLDAWDGEGAAAAAVQPQIMDVVTANLGAIQARCTFTRHLPAGAAPGLA